MTAANILSATSENIVTAARLVNEGKLVAFPTETVYGLGADATNDEAVASVFSAKARPTFNPLIIHFKDMDAAARAVTFNERAERLAGAIWPGSLTLVLPRRPECEISLLAAAGLDSLAVRVPGDDVALTLLREAGCPLTAPSANRSGDVSPTTAAHVAESLGDAVEVILDGGPSRVGIESAIVDLTDETTVVLRPGAVAMKNIEALAGPVASACAAPCAGPPASGRKASFAARHYTTGLPLRLNVAEAQLGEAFLAFGPDAREGDAAHMLNLSPAGDFREAAANLFSMLHELDSPEYYSIAVMPIPEDGLGRAINDRLRRVAGHS